VRWDFGYCGHYWPIVPAPDDRWGWLWRNWWHKDWDGKPKYAEKTCPSATLSTTTPTTPTWLDSGLNPARRGGKPATNRLSYGAAYVGLQFGAYISVAGCKQNRNNKPEANSKLGGCRYTQLVYAYTSMCMSIHHGTVVCNQWQQGRLKTHGHVTGNDLALV
jgi:hypothetical protein